MSKKEAQTTETPEIVPVAPETPEVSENAVVSAPVAPVTLTPDQIEAAAAAERERLATVRADVGTKYYRSAHGGLMIDPETGKEFNGENATKSVLTSWLQLQLDAKKIVEDTE